VLPESGPRPVLGPSLVSGPPLVAASPSEVEIALSDAEPSGSLAVVLSFVDAPVVLVHIAP